MKSWNQRNLVNGKVILGLDPLLKSTWKILISLLLDGLSGRDEEWFSEIEWLYAMCFQTISSVSKNFLAQKEVPKAPLPINPQKFNHTLLIFLIDFFLHLKIFLHIQIVSRTFLMVYQLFSVFYQSLLWYMKHKLFQCSHDKITTTIPLWQQNSSSSKTNTIELSS